MGEKVGAYRLISKLGEGGMGEIYLAEHITLGNKVAIKVLLEEFSKNPGILKRFFQEAKAASQIRHPGIVQVLDFGQRKKGGAYMVMELLDGDNLHDRIAARGRLPHSQACTIGKQIANALAAAHERGIIHRDLKPENVMLVPDTEVPGGERVKVLDFGIAKLARDTGPSLVKTASNTVLGSPLYMSPEQSSGSESIDYRTDIYSLGCMLFEMTCGRLPFEGPGIGDILGAHIYAEPPKPRSLNPRIPEILETLILGCLAKDPAERPQTMAKVSRFLEACAQEPAAEVSETPDSATAASTETPGQAPKRTLAGIGNFALSDTGAQPRSSTSQIGEQWRPQTQEGASVRRTTAGHSSGEIFRTIWQQAKRPRGILIGTAAVGLGVLAFLMMTREPEKAAPRPQPIAIRDSPSPTEKSLSAAPSAQAEDKHAADTITAVAPIAVPPTGPPAIPTSLPSSSNLTSQPAAASPARPTPAAPKQSAKEVAGRPPRTSEGEAPKPQHTQIVLTSDPAGALVIAKGRYLGMTPFSIDKDSLTSGQYILRCVGYKDTPVTGRLAGPVRLTRSENTPLGLDCGR